MKIAWLDASSAQQKRMHELAGLFSEKDTLDELGLGAVRDTLGSICFPGSSTLHTRARYLLFIPWLHQLTGARTPSAQTQRQVREAERRFIEEIRHHSAGADLMGLFGARNVRIERLASDVYSWLMIPHGIMFDPSSATSRRLLAQMGYDDVAQAPLIHPTIPAPPEGFPQVTDGFALAQHEAEWLRERILASSPDTVQAHFLTHRPDRGSRFPWEDPAAASITGQAAEHLRIAQRFSTTIHGAQLLYNLMLSERQAELFAERGTDQPPRGDAEGYRERIAEWAEEVSSAAAWDLEEIIGLTEEHRRRPLRAGLRQFLQEWDAVLQRTGPHGVTEDPEARRMVQARESMLKRSQSRFSNRTLLASWGGASGAGRFTMRWQSSVRRILLDIHDGLERTAAPSAEGMVAAGA